MLVESRLRKIVRICSLNTVKTNNKKPYLNIYLTIPKGKKFGWGGNKSLGGA